MMEELMSTGCILGLILRVTCYLISTRLNKITTFVRFNFLVVGDKEASNANLFSFTRITK